MKKYLILICTSFFLVSAGAQTISPQVIASGGDFYTGVGVSLSWTLGELITETVTDGTYILTQGFQQPHYIISSIDDPKADDNPLGNINVYPNPVSDQLNVAFTDINQKNVVLTLIDFNGKILISDLIENTNAVKQLDMNNVAKGTYILRLSTRDGKSAKSFKIVKY